MSIWTAFNARRHADRAEQRVATARAHAAAGRSLTTAADELGMPVKALRKALDRAQHHDLVVRLQQDEEVAT